MAQEMKVPITRKSVNSSNIKSVGYSKEGKVLEVEFWGKPSDKNSTKIYRYWPVLESFYEDMMKAESIGKYFAEHIRYNEKISYLQVN